MKTKKIFIVAVMMFILVFSVAVTSLIISAGPGTGTSTKGVWAEVCCGKACSGGYDYCAGNGTYICCK